MSRSTERLVRDDSPYHGPRWRRPTRGSHVFICRTGARRRAPINAQAGILLHLRAEQNWSGEAFVSNLRAWLGALTKRSTGAKSTIAPAVASPAGSGSR